MILWTIQPVKFLQELRKKRYIEGCSSLVEKDPFAKDSLCEYRWMAKQMELRKKCDKITYPLWAWYKYDGVHKKPDLRCSGHLPRGTKGVCIEFEKPDGEVLLSQFEMWVFAMNGWCIGHDEKESSAIDEIESANTLSSKRIKASWTRMFDLSFGSEASWDKLEERWIQACFAGLHIDQIRRVTKFVAR